MLEPLDLHQPNRMKKGQTRNQNFDSPLEWSSKNDTRDPTPSKWSQQHLHQVWSLPIFGSHVMTPVIYLGKLLLLIPKPECFGHFGEISLTITTSDQPEGPRYNLPSHKIPRNNLTSPKKPGRILSMKYWLVNRDPYFMVYYNLILVYDIIPIWVFPKIGLGPPNHPF